MKKMIGWTFLVLVSFGFGLGIGLGISWGILPTRNKDALPNRLNNSDKDTYRSIIAYSYYITRDLTRAEIRMGLLDGEGELSALEDQIELIPLDQASGVNHNALLVLYDVLSNSQDLSTPMITLTFKATQTIYSLITQSIDFGSGSPFPTGYQSTTTSTLPSKPLNFMIRNKVQVCDASQDTALLQVIVYDKSGKPASGTVIIVSSSFGLERILTGLRPEMSEGYVDFRLTPGVIYSFIIEGANGNQEEVSTAECTSSIGGTYSGGWLYEIQY